MSWPQGTPSLSTEPVGENPVRNPPLRGLFSQKVQDFGGSLGWTRDYIAVSPKPHSRWSLTHPHISYVCMHMCMYVHMWVHVCMHMGMCVHVRTCEYIGMGACATDTCGGQRMTSRTWFSLSTMDPEAQLSLPDLNGKWFYSLTCLKGPSFTVSAIASHTQWVLI